MKGNIYIVTLEGEIKYASNLETVASGYAENANGNALLDAINEAGRDIEDLTPEEISEFEIVAGFDGLYEVKSVNIPEGFDPDETFELDNGDSFTYGDVAEVYEEMDEDFMFEFDSIEDTDDDFIMDEVFGDDEFDEEFDGEFDEDFEFEDEDSFNGTFNDN